MDGKLIRAKLGLPESATDAEVDTKLAEMATASTRLHTTEQELEKEKKERAAAEIVGRRASANAKVDAWQHEGRITGNATAAVREFYVPFAAGEIVTPAQFEAVMAALPQMSTTRLSTDVAKSPAGSSTSIDVTAEDFRKEATSAECAKRISAAVTERRKTDPKFTKAALRREVLGQ